MKFEEFALTMITLARRIPRFAPDFHKQDIVTAWYEELGGLADADLAAACKAAIRRFDDFPSIKQLMELARPKASKEEAARLVPDLIWKAIESCGTPNKVRARAQMGELAWAVVEHAGGWSHVCETATYDAMTTMKAQWRGIAESVHAQVEAGLPLAPSLPEPAGALRGAGGLRAATPEDYLGTLKGHAKFLKGGE